MSLPPASITQDDSGVTGVVINAHPGIVRPVPFDNVPLDSDEGDEGETTAPPHDLRKDS